MPAGTREGSPSSSRAPTISGGSPSPWACPISSASILARKRGRGLLRFLWCQLLPDVLGRRALGHEGEKRDRPGQCNQDQPLPGPPGPPTEVERGDQKQHVKPAVWNGRPGDNGVIVTEVLQRNPHAHENDKQDSDRVGHDPVADQRVAHGPEPMSVRYGKQPRSRPPVDRRCRLGDLDPEPFGSPSPPQTRQKPTTAARKHRYEVDHGRSAGWSQRAQALARSRQLPTI